MPSGWESRTYSTTQCFILGYSPLLLPLASASDPLPYTCRWFSARHALRFTPMLDGLFKGPAPLVSNQKTNDPVCLSILDRMVYMNLTNSHLIGKRKSSVPSFSLFAIARASDLRSNRTWSESQAPSIKIY